MCDRELQVGGLHQETLDSEKDWIKNGRGSFEKRESNEASSYKSHSSEIVFDDYVFNWRTL